MAYTAYKTWTVGEILTAANMNAQVRDNGLLGPEALATADGEVWIATGANAGEMVAILDANNRLKHEYGGLEFDASGVTTGDILVGQSAGVIGLETAMSQAQAEAGTDTQVRGITAARVKEAIDANVTAAAVVRQGGNTTNVSTVSTSAVDLFTASSLSILAEEHFLYIYMAGKSSGAADDAHTGLKLTTTPSGAVIVQEAATNSSGWRASTTDRVESGLAFYFVGARTSNFSNGNRHGMTISVSSGQVHAIGQNAPAQNATNGFVTEEITSLIVRGITDNASNTLSLDSLHVFSFGAS